jgi:hypothetical protein
MLAASSAHSSTLYLSPGSQTVEQTCSLYVSAEELSAMVGLDVRIAWDSGVIRCTAVQSARSELFGFSGFYKNINNNIRSLESVLLRQSSGGYTGAADSFLVLTFEPVSSGTTCVCIEKSYLDGDPIVLDENGGSVEVEVDTAVIIVTEPESPPVITTVRLYQNYPNPFNPGTTIRFDIPAPSPVWLRIFDVSGALIRTVIDGEEYGYGTWEVRWDGRNSGSKLVPSGIYFCTFEAGGRKATTKLVVLR